MLGTCTFPKDIDPSPSVHSIVHPARPALAKPPLAKGHILEF